MRTPDVFGVVHISGRHRQNVYFFVDGEGSMRALMIRSGGDPVASPVGGTKRPAALAYGKRFAEPVTVFCGKRPKAESGIPKTIPSGSREQLGRV